MLVFKNGVPKEWHNPLLQVYSRAPMGRAKIIVKIDDKYGTCVVVPAYRAVSDCVKSASYFLGTILLDKTDYPIDILQASFAHELGHLCFFDQLNRMDRHRKEFTADAFAASLGYGKGLINYLSTCRNKEECRTHPSSAARISNILEHMR